MVSPSLTKTINASLSLHSITQPITLLKTMHYVLQLTIPPSAMQHYATLRNFTHPACSVNKQAEQGKEQQQCAMKSQFQFRSDVCRKDRSDELGFKGNLLQLNDLPKNPY